MTHGSLFSGIGGFDLAAQKMGWENIFHCEWNPFGQKILKYYWPNAVSYEDIKTTDFSIHRGTIDVLTGGFPCQPYSLAGLRKGKEDERHLWPEMLRAIREIKPRWVVGENVLGLVGWNDGMVFEEVQTDLEAEGYEVQPYVLPAASVDAPHRRDRVWFVAYCSSNGRQRPDQFKEDDYSGVRERLDEGYEFDSLHGIGPTANTDNNGPHGTEDGQGLASRTNGNKDRSDETGKLKGHSKKGPTFTANSDGFSEDVADSNNINGDLSGLCSSELSQQQEADLFGNKTSPDDEHTNCKRCEKFNITEESKGSPFDSRGHNDYWNNWPTQSPVCDGNDGISSRLDGITFSKWRTESIKAGGNAIVHQVVLQIFKAIQEYELLPKKELQEKV